MSKITFLPSNYEAPKTSNYYMKLQEGDNKFRILTQPILGWEDWVEDSQGKRPIRFRFEEKPLKSQTPEKPVRHFWAFVVWNYNEEQIQILHITQATIRTALESLCNDQDWGAPFFYDIKIIKKGEGKDTAYTTNPLPHKPLAKHIAEAFKDRPCNLDAMYENADPFSKEWETHTPGVLSQDNMNFETLDKRMNISYDQMVDLKDIFDGCDPLYVKKVMKHLEDSTFKVNCLEEIPLEIYQKIKDAALKKRDEYQLLMKDDLEVMHG